LTRELENMLRLRTFPIAFKRIEKVADLDNIPRLRKMERTSNFCQLVTLARTAGWTIGATADSMQVACGTVVGLREPPGGSYPTQRAGVWYCTEEDARQAFTAMRRIPYGGYQAIALAPLASEKFEPDVILIYGTPAQIIMLICALQTKEYERFNFFCIGESACSDSLSECYVSGKPAVAIPCFGERRFGAVQEEELDMALPPAMLDKAVEGLRWLASKGLRYPIVPWGAECDPTPALARSYPSLDKKKQ
jgi:uncharacterized protein (DUF169 family)